ncbi:MAG: SDR family NAD(P)-dependent oxidoreductase [Gammaproteobacteria bacterium]
MAAQLPYKEKIVVITGAGSGIGRQLALRYSADQARLALCDIDPETLAETAQLCRDAGASEVQAEQLDVAGRQEVYQWAERINNSMGPADVVVNNAGIAYVAGFDEQDMDYFERVMQVNFYGVVWGCRAFLPQLRQTQGSIVNISSIFGMAAASYNSAYNASKFAVRAISEVLWTELYGTGVHVASVHPGGVKTNIARLARVDVKTNRDFAEAFDAVARTTAPSAAAQIYKGVLKKKKRILVGADAKFLSFVLRLLPNHYVNAIPLLRRRYDE